MRPYSIPTAIEIGSAIRLPCPDSQSRFHKCAPMGIECGIQDRQLPVFLELVLYDTRLLRSAEKNRPGHAPSGQITYPFALGRTDTMVFSEDSQFSASGSLAAHCFRQAQP